MATGKFPLFPYAPSIANKIKVVRQLLDPSPMQGTVATLHALHTQRETAHYGVKENKSRLPVHGQR